MFDLKFAAGGFSDFQSATEEEWVELPNGMTPAEGLFVAQVIGESMNKRIPNGSWCLFRAKPAGTRQGKIVVAQHRAVSDAENGASYTVKTYSSEKTGLADGTWRHVRVTLSPSSTDPSFRDIVLLEDDAASVNIVAELMAVLL